MIINWWTGGACDYVDLSLIQQHVNFTSDWKARVTLS